MTRFMHDDRVRISTPNEPTWNNRVGRVLDLQTIGETFYYIVLLDDLKYPAAFTEWEVRPADIFAWVKDDPDAIEKLTKEREDG